MILASVVFVTIHSGYRGQTTHYDNYDNSRNLQCTFVNLMNPTYLPSHHHYSPVIRLRHMVLFKRVVADSLID